MRTPDRAVSRSVTRRALMAASLSAFVSGIAGRAPVQAASTGTWKPWLLSASDALRPASPGSVSADDLSEVVASQRQATASSLATIERWDDPTVILPWTNLALDLIKVHHPNPVRTGRALALLQVALFDTLVATEDARSVYPQPGPATDKAVTLLGRTPADPNTFPSAHAAVATAAATVLAYLFPDEPAPELLALADEAATSRLMAGQAFRRDIAAGQAIGAAVAALAVARGQADGSSASWDGAGRLTGAGYWQPTPPGYFQQPTEPLAGTWRPWILASGDQYRPPAPPAYRSPAWEAELAGVQEAVARRTEEQAQAVRFWAGGPGTVTPAGLWTEIARELIVRDALDPLRAARVLALTSVAMADGFICCWDAKYTYWSERPITADPNLDVLIPTPPFPSFTSGHSTVSAAAGAVLGHLFPSDEAELAARADEAKSSRLWAGIHFPIDNEMGALGGGMIGRLVVARARTEEGAEVVA